MLKVVTRQYTTIPVQGHWQRVMLVGEQLSYEPILGWVVETLVYGDDSVVTFPYPITVSGEVGNATAILRPDGIYERPFLDEFNTADELLAVLKATDKLRA